MSQKELLKRQIDEIDSDFWFGNIAALQGKFCPKCGGRLMYSVYKGNLIPNASVGRRYQCGVSIYCVGECNSMLVHGDGYLPAWAETIQDWDQFSKDLYLS